MPKASPSETGGQRPSALEMFTDRVQEQELLREIMRPEPTKAERGELFLTVFYGVGGVGKSTLCRRAYEIAKEQDAKELVLVTVDYDGSGWSPETAFVGVVNELVRAFADKGVSPRLSGSLLALYAQHDSRTGGESISVDERWGLAMESLDKGVELAGIPGLGLLLKGAKWVKDRAQRGALQKQLRELGLWPEDQFGRVDLIDLEAKIGRALFEDVRNFLNDSPDRHVRLLIDGFERLQSHERKADAQMRLQDFLGYFAASKDPAACNRFRVLIFGREKLRWDELYADDDWCRFWNQHLLAGLAERDARDFLERYRQWFQTHEQQALAVALKDYEEQILDATDELADGERMFYPFYLNLAVELLERSVSRGEKPDLGRSPVELQDRFFKYLAPAELRVLMVLGLAEVFDEALYDWLAKERVIEFPLHSFHTAVRKEHSYFQEVEHSASNWRFHRLFEEALQAKWLTGDAQRHEGQAVTRRLLGYYAEALGKVPERDWTRSEVDTWCHGMEIIVTQGPVKGLLGVEEWVALLDAQSSRYHHYLCRAPSSLFMQRTLRECERLFGRGHPYTLAAVTQLASLGGGDEKAETLCRRALEVWDEYDPEFSITLEAAHNLGVVLCGKGEYEEAEKLLRRALDGNERLYGPEHPDTLATAHVLGKLFTDKGDYTQGGAFLNRALSGKERVLGIDHPHTLSSVNSLGNLLYRMGDLKDSEVLHRRAFETRVRVLGADHPDTLQSANNLGNLFYCKGDYEGAQAFFGRVLASREKTLGPEHGETLQSCYALGISLLNTGRAQEAEALLYRELKSARANRDTPLGSVLKSVKTYASCLKALGRISEAAAVLRPYLGQDQDCIRYNLACYECLSGNQEEARRLLRDEFVARPSRLEFALADDDLIAIRAELASMADGNVTLNDETSGLLDKT